MADERLKGDRGHDVLGSFVVARQTYESELQSQRMIPYQFEDNIPILPKGEAISPKPTMAFVS
jgi:hypothetical protein